MQAPLSSASVVVVVQDAVPPPDLWDQLSARLADQFVDWEYILVANGTEPRVALELKELVARLPDSLAVFLAERVHGDVARLVGVDHAVSDHVLFCTPCQPEIENIAALVRPLRDGFEAVIGQDRDRRSGSLGRRVLFRLFRAVYRWTAHSEYEPYPPTFRIMSRAAALYVGTRANGEVLVRSRDLGSGFPITSVRIPSGPQLDRTKESVFRAIARGARLIATGSTALLRASSYLAVAGGLASGLYALYVIAVYLLLSEVEPGWTSLSLQLSGMLLLFSLQFFLLTEHVIQIAANNPASSRRHLVIREIRSPLSRRSARLNVVDHEGRFQLGAPAEFVHREAQQVGP